MLVDAPNMILRSCLNYGRTVWIKLLLDSYSLTHLLNHKNVISDTKIMVSRRHLWTKQKLYSDVWTHTK